MQRLVVVGAALFLLLAVVVWWRNDRAAIDDLPTTSPGVDASTDAVADQPLLKQGVDASTEQLAAATISVADQSAAVAVSESSGSVGTNAQPKCLRKEATTQGAAFELNASLRNNEPSTLDKQACYAAVGEIKRARWMFDSTPNQTVAHTPRWDINWLGRSVQETVLHELCSGDVRYDAGSEATVVLYFVTASETTKILIGPYWVSDGTIRSPLTDGQYVEITKTLSRRRRDDIGPAGNMSPELFNKRLQERYFNQVTAETEAQERSAEDLQRAQRGLPADCVE